MEWKGVIPILLQKSHQKPVELNRSNKNFFWKWVWSNDSRLVSESLLQISWNHFLENCSNSAANMSAKFSKRLFYKVNFEFLASFPRTSIFVRIFRHFAKSRQSHDPFLEPNSHHHTHFYARRITSRWMKTTWPLIWNHSRLFCAQKKSKIRGCKTFFFTIDELISLSDLKRLRPKLFLYTFCAHEKKKKTSSSSSMLST